MSKIKRSGNVGVISNDVGTYSFEITGMQKIASGVLPFNTGTRSTQPLQLQNYKIIPFGEQNNYPDELRAVLDENNLTPEVLNKQASLLWGQGPALYLVKFENGKRVKHWLEDKEVEKWLKSWDYEDYLRKATVEFRTLNGHFTKYFRNKAPRIGGKGFITHLEHVSSVKSRLEWPDNNDKIQHIITGNYNDPSNYQLRQYKIFNPQAPFLFPVSMRYSNMYSFALDNDYSRSPIHGSLNWIKLGSTIAKLLMAFNNNSMAIKYHIQSPAVYWEKEEEALKEDCLKKGIVYSSKMLDKRIDEKMLIITNTLAGMENTGKLLHTKQVFDELEGKYVDWKIDTLDQKVKDFIDAQINISKRAALETTSGLGLHPALSNISTDGNLPSGSEQLYAFKLYLLTGVDIPESIVCRDINNAIAANFPGKDIKLGFYHDVVMTEEMTSSKDRIKNN